MSREKRLVFAAAGLISAAVLFLLFHVVLPWNTEPLTLSQPGRSAGQARLSQTAAKEGWVDVNQADGETLQQLPGIGPAIAEKILRERQENGPFFFPEDLLRVSGIGEKTLEKIRDFLWLE